MKKKNAALLLLLSGGLLAACSNGSGDSSSSADPSSTPTSSLDSSADASSIADDSSAGNDSSSVAEDFTVVEALDALEALTYDNVVSYDYYTRVYSYNYVTELVLENYEQTNSYTINQSNVEGTVSTSELSGAVTTSVTSTSQGDYLAYSLSDYYYASVNSYTGEDAGDSTYTISEQSPYCDLVDQHDYVSSLVDYAYNTFTYPEGVYSSYNGWAVSEVEITLADGVYTVIYQTSAEADGYYAAEDSYIEATFSASDHSILSVTFYDLVFNGDRVDDVEAGANGISIERISNIVTGTKAEKEITPVDPSSFNSENVTGKIPEAIEISEGNVSESQVASIFDNIDAYTQGAVTSTYQSSVLTEDWETGETYTEKTSGTRSAYLNDILIVNETYEGGSYSSYYAQTVGDGESITQTFGYDNDLSSYMVGEVDTTSLNSVSMYNYYLGAHAYYTSFLGEYGTFAVENGFKTVEESVDYDGITMTSSTTMTLVSATCDASGVTSIDIDYVSSFLIDYGGGSTYSTTSYVDIALTVDNGFLSAFSLEVGTSEGNPDSTYSYSITKGEPSAYDGELL